jgi:hypothetical protein
MRYGILQAGYVLSSMEDQQNLLTPIFGGRNGLSLFGTDRSRQDIRPERPTPTMSDLGQHMGSTTFGIDGSTDVGLAMPQDIKDQSRRLSPREGDGRA